MSTLMGSDVEAALRRLGNAWAWILAFGVLSILAGLVAIFWPGATLLVIAIVFAVQLIVGGVFRFVGALPSLARQDGFAPFRQSSPSCHSSSVSTCLATWH